MTKAVAGQRIALSGHGDILIRFDGGDSARIAVSAFTASGGFHAMERISATDWRLTDYNSDTIEIVAYIIDDRQGGSINPAYPCSIIVGAQRYELPKPDQQLAAVIMAEIYTKGGQRRLKIANEGFTFGIDAYVRARNLGHVPIPYRATPPPEPRGRDWSEGPRPSPGQAFASGSGVIVGHDLVVTNAHVIEHGDGFTLGRSRTELTLVAVDPLHDLALLQGPVGRLPLPIRIASPIWLGEAIMAAGYPLMDVLGADLKVTTGNISGLTGSHGDISRFQFSAPIGSGSSGGAIIDEDGNLVGITAASLAHQNFRDRGSISENVNFGVRAAMVFELIAAAGMPVPSAIAHVSGSRRDITNRLRSSVVSILVSG